MFVFVSSLPEVSAALQRFLMSEAAALPEFVRGKIAEAGLHPSPVMRVVESTEALWAVRADLSPNGRELLAQLAQFAAFNGFHDMQDRGAAMVAALCRDEGFEPMPGQQWPIAEQDPPVLESMIEPVAEEAAEEPVELLPLGESQ